MKRKPTPTEKRTVALLDEFDAAARDWGWQQDQGTGKSVDNAEARYHGARTELIAHLNRMHTRLRKKQ